MKNSYILAVILFCSILQAEQKPTETEIIDSISTAKDPIHNDSTHKLEKKESEDITVETGPGKSAPTIEPANQPSSSTPASVIEESEEDLFLDGGEESIIAPSVQEKDTKHASEPGSESSDSAKTQPASTVAIDTAGGKPDSASSQQSHVLPYPKEAMPTPAPPPPMRIEKTNSINFAKNYKEYRSPKLAILLSLLAPGAGQAYAHNLLKTGIFGAVEVGIITTGAILGYKGNQKWKSAKRYADEHYDIELFEDYHQKIVRRFSADEEVIQNIFYYADSVDNVPHFLESARKRDQEFYDNIKYGDQPYIQGWKDAKPTFDDNFEIIQDDQDKASYFPMEDSVYLVYRVDESGDTSKYAQYGYSEYQKVYQDKLSKSNKNFRASKTVLTLLIVNHIVSAIDAGITAKSYNDKLLGKSSFWQKINLRDTYVSTPFGPAGGFALEVRF